MAEKSKLDVAIQEIVDNVRINTYKDIKAHCIARADRRENDLCPEDDRPLLIEFDTEYQTIRSVIRYLDNQIQLLKGVKK